MADWLKPTTQDLYTDVLGQLDARLNDLALMFKGSTSVNLPTGTFRFNGTNNTLESWSGTAWAAESLGIKSLNITSTDSVATNTAIQLASNGNIAATDNMRFFIDSDNNSTANAFTWYTNSSNTTNASTLMQLIESGTLYLFLNNNISLSGTSGSLIVGSTAHLAFDNNTIQAKASSTTAATLEINPFGGAVNVGGPINITSLAASGTASFTDNITITSNTTAYMKLEELDAAVDYKNWGILAGSGGKLYFRAYSDDYTSLYDAYIISRTGISNAYHSFKGSIEIKNGYANMLVGAVTGTSIATSRLYFAPRLTDNTNWDWNNEFSYDFSRTQWVFDQTPAVGNNDILHTGGGQSVAGTFSATDHISVIGTSTGTANLSYLRLYESDGSTFAGHFGFGSNANTVLSIRNGYASGDITILAQKSDNSGYYTAALFNQGAQKLYYLGAQKFETDVNGIRVRGNTTGTANIASVKFYDSAGVYQAFIGKGSSTDSTFHILNILNGGQISMRVRATSGTDYYNLVIKESVVSLRYYGSEKLVTSSAGITVTGTGTASDWVATSDLALKSNLKKITGALDKVLAINGYTFDKAGNTDRMAGVIAQEIMKVLPEGVTKGEYLGVYNSAIIGLLIEAIKELANK